MADIDWLWSKQESVESILKAAEDQWGITKAELQQAKSIVERVRKELERTKKKMEETAKKYSEMVKGYKEGYTTVRAGTMMDMYGLKKTYEHYAAQAEKLNAELDKALKLVAELAAARGQYSAFRSLVVG